MQRHRIALGLVAFLALAGCLAGDEPVPPFHVLIANDDGIDASGIEALVTAMAADPSYRVTVVAPAGPQSGKGHALTMGGLLAVRSHASIAGAVTWSVKATPATTVRLALSALLADDPPQLVLSGINRGENAGRIAWYSGTVGGARRRSRPAFRRSPSRCSWTGRTLSRTTSLRRRWPNHWSTRCARLPSLRVCSSTSTSRGTPERSGATGWRGWGWPRTGLLAMTWIQRRPVCAGTGASGHPPSSTNLEPTPGSSTRGG